MNITCHTAADTLALSPRTLAAHSGKAEADTARAAHRAAAPATLESIASAAQSAPAGRFTNADLQELNAQWGEKDSPYDLDGDGLVDIDDLLMMLSQLEAESEPTMAPPVTSGTPSIEAAEVAEVRSAARVQSDVPAASETQPPAFDPAPAAPTQAQAYGQGDLDGLLAAWGESNSRYDLDGNGVVGIDDLLMLMSNWQQPAMVECGPGETATAITSDGPANPHTSRGPVHYEPAALSALAPGSMKKLSASLIDKLVAAGFEDRPPSNMREVVDRLNLQPGDQRLVLAALKDRYPHGLGVNLRA